MLSSHVPLCEHYADKVYLEILFEDVSRFWCLQVPLAGCSRGEYDGTKACFNTGISPGPGNNLKSQIKKKTRRDLSYKHECYVFRC